MTKRNAVVLINKYLKRISKDDKHLTSIHLTKLGLLDADLAPLFKAFKKNPDAAARIKEIFLNLNELEVITITGFPNLKKLHLAHNNLRAINLKSLPKLTHLYAGNNSCTSAHLEHIPSLTTISFAHNEELVSAHISQLTTPVKRFVVFDAEPLTAVNRIALQKIAAQDPLLTVKLNSEHSRHNVADENLALTAPLLAQHFTIFCATELSPLQATLNFYAWFFCQVNERISPDIMMLTSTLLLELDALSPDKLLKKEIKFLKGAFNSESVELDEDGFLAVTHDPSTLNMFNRYTRRGEFKQLKNFCRNPAGDLLPSFCESFELLSRKKRAVATDLKPKL